MIPEAAASNQSQSYQRDHHRPAPAASGIREFYLVSNNNTSKFISSRESSVCRNTKDDRPNSGWEEIAVSAA